MCLASWPPGREVAEIIANTGWALEVLPQAGATLAPTAAELAALRRVDSEGFWRR